MTTPTKVAALLGPGDHIGYEGKWRTVKTTKTDIGSMGGLFVVVAWEEGGTDRFRAGDELLVGTPAPPPAGG
ncbi:hypothetical protein [Streptomyces tagetis]|uniref:Uncharacterized protein n=1 Tax=Streptomyces tagetis TaxID=2820809 RepID=A0A941AWU5_9ACTN|nr:hypothetical protein [Streptomyces sp. RG38]MBQ0825219.1 hypothetical protein [Streptomyces sp. RG38]